MGRQSRGGRRGTAKAPELSHADLYDEVDDFHQQTNDLDSDYIKLTESSEKPRDYSRKIQLSTFNESEDSENEDFEEENDVDDDIKEALEEEEAITAAWGKKKNQYYDHDVKGMSKKDEEIEREEEEEVKRLRNERMAFVDDELYEDDMLGSLVQKQKQEKQAEIESEPLNFRKEVISGSISDLSALDLLNNVSVEKLSKDLSNFSKEEKVDYLMESKPELFDLLEELEEKSSILKDEIEPLLEVIQSRFPKGVEDSNFPSQLHHLVMTRKRLLLSFCGNLAFCLTMVTKGKSLKDHPVAESMVKLDELLQLSQRAIYSQEDVLRKLVEAEEEEVFANTFEVGDEETGSDEEESDHKETNENIDVVSVASDSDIDEFEKNHSIADLVEAPITPGKKSKVSAISRRRRSKLHDYISGPQEDENSDEEFSVLDKKRPIKTVISPAENVHDEDFEQFSDNDIDFGLEHGEENNSGSQERTHEETEGDAEEKSSAVPVIGPVKPDPDFIDGRRAITSTIMKNQGLKRYRKKENKNPRVKHRNKYEKAVKKHKRLVKQFSEQNFSNYGGEETGIKDYVVKSTRIY